MNKEFFQTVLSLLSFNCSFGILLEVHSGIKITTKIMQIKVKKEAEAPKES